MAERAFVEKLGRAGFVDVVVHWRREFGIDDCARYPHFTPDLVDLMRRTIPPERHAVVATGVVVSARKDDARAHDLIASSQKSNPASRPLVLKGMSEHTYDAKDRGCSDGLGKDLRLWWESLEPGTTTTIVLRDPAAKADIPAFARMLGHTITDERQADTTLVLSVRTKGA